MTYRVLVHKEAPIIVYTGLTKIIGKPRELEKNKEEQAYFESQFDFMIPVKDTHEFAEFET